MAGPTWLRWLLTAALLAVAGYCVARLAAAHRVPGGYPGGHRALDVAHLIMALGMAVMVSPVGGPLPAAAWQTAYLLIAAWFLGSTWRSRNGVHPEPPGWHGGGLHHAAAAFAMLYMIIAMPGDARHLAAPWLAVHHPDPGPAGWILSAYFALSAVVLGRRVLRPVPARPALPAVLAAPRLAAGCQVAMAVSMSYMVMP